MTAMVVNYHRACDHGNVSDNFLQASLSPCHAYKNNVLPTEFDVVVVVNIIVITYSVIVLLIIIAVQYTSSASATLIQYCALY